MLIYEDQIHIQAQKLEAAITLAAWGLVEQIIEEQRNRLVVEFTTNKLGTGDPQKTITSLRLLNNKRGTWSRGDGNGTYKVIGMGKLPGTVSLKNVTTGKIISSAIKTLTSRKWKHSL